MKKDSLVENTWLSVKWLWFTANITTASHFSHVEKDFSMLNGWFILNKYHLYIAKSSEGYEQCFMLTLKNEQTESYKWCLIWIYMKTLHHHNQHNIQIIRGKLVTFSLFNLCRNSVLWIQHKDSSTNLQENRSIFIY